MNFRQFTEKIFKDIETRLSSYSTGTLKVRFFLSKWKELRKNFKRKHAILMGRGRLWAGLNTPSIFGLK